jgi:hypothetical protein
LRALRPVLHGAGIGRAGAGEVIGQTV